MRFDVFETELFRNRRGFTLIEVLVALLILSIGLLGLAALQGRGLRDNHSALLRSQAVNQAEDILDRMRANRAAAVNGDYDINLGDGAAAPTYTGLVLIDLQEWKAMLTASLPTGDGSIAMDGNVCTVIVQWGEAEGDQTVTVVTRL